MTLPKRYTPKALRSKEPEKREQIVYAIGDEHKPGSFSMWNGPTPNLEEMLEVVPEHEEYESGYGKLHKHIDSCIIRFNLDGSDEVIYRWRASLSNRLGHWFIQEGVE